MAPRAVQPPRIAAVLAPVLVAGGIAFVAALVSYAAVAHGPAELLGVALLLSATAVAERYPVPVEGVDASGVSLGFVFGVAAIVLYGWDAGVIVLATPQAVIQVVERRPPIRIAFNFSVFALAAALSGALGELVRGGGTARLVATLCVVAVVQYAVNLVLVTAAIAASSRRRYVPLVRSNVAWTALPFALMGSAALILVVLWQRTPSLAAALAGPLIAISLYQRSTHAALSAMRLALTDPLTGLGNHRHFHERLAAALATASDRRARLGLCFLDVDDFKRINDGHGHPAGDRVLAQVGACLRQGGEAFRLGGDEFALILIGSGEDSSLEIAEAVVRRMADLEVPHVGRITVSAGVSTYPLHATGLNELIGVTDRALYWAKEHGKNRVRLARPELVELAELGRLGEARASVGAALALARAVDARDTYAVGHSERVADLAARIALRLGLGREQTELARLAGGLHDLGKAAVPEEILRKPGALTPRERTAVERHSEIGHRLLASLGVDTVADWVLHHHERWDGGGYPEGLSGDEIPLGARIVFVADAFDAIVSLAHSNEPAALAELERCAGSQFDPRVVAALAAELESELTATAIAS